MKTRTKITKSKPAMDQADMIKLQVDPRTVIFLRTKKALSMWMERYPNARVIAA